MPMLSPLVWAIHAPDRAVACQTAAEAVELVNAGQTVVLPDYSSAVRTLIKLGADPDWALHLAEVARRQPQHQDSYLP
jgi:hypothetical protein